MPIETPDELHISSGPRWEELRLALDQAEEGLGPPLDEAEIARGWTEHLREMILRSVKDIKTVVALASRRTRSGLSAAFSHGTSTVMSGTSSTQ